jgi:hypothetical protein
MLRYGGLKWGGGETTKLGLNSVIFFSIYFVEFDHEKYYSDKKEVVP